MGLDMYLEGRKSRYDKQETEDGFPLQTKVLRLGYWRKHPNLHGYIVQTFADGVDECQEIELSADDIRKIMQAIKNKELPHTEGFFFGNSDDSWGQRQHDLATFEKALAWMENVEKAELKKVKLAGATAVMIDADTKLPDEYRDVIYRASW